MAIELSLIRLKLEQIRQQLIEELDQSKANGGATEERRNGSAFSNREEAAVATSDLERRIALETQKRNNLAEVEHTLHKLEEGSYGTCDSCGQPIESGRLEVLVYASQCMTCKAAGKKANKDCKTINGQAF